MGAGGVGPGSIRQAARRRGGSGCTQNTRYEDLTPTQRENFVELTGKAGTVVIFTHDIIHTSWHETDTYRRVVHCTYQTGSEVAAPTNDVPEEWLE